MSKIEAWQHIYSNVEKAQSPSQRGGFQTLFYTRAGLTESEIEEMEGRLLYFPSPLPTPRPSQEGNASGGTSIQSEIEPIKKVFFSTSSGKIVVAQIVSLLDPDQAGRGGRYLAHSLIFDAEEFVRSRLEPFQILRQYSFVTSVDEALQRGDFQSGDIPVISLDIQNEPTPGPSQEGNSCGGDSPLIPLLGGARGGWQPEALKRLVALALNAGFMAQERSTVAFLGKSVALEEALETALCFVPSVLLPHCSFDTYFYRCNLVATYYWGVGLSDTTNPKLIVVDADSKQVKQETALPDETAYQRWVMAMIDERKLSYILQHKDTAFALSDVLHDRSGDNTLLDQASNELIQSVFEVNAQQVQERIHRSVEQQLPALLEERIFPHIYPYNDPGELLDRLRHGFTMEFLLTTLYDAYTSQSFQKPGGKEHKALKSLLDEHDHQELRLLLAAWSGHKDLQNALAQINDDDYQKFVRKLLRFELVKPLTVLLPEKAGSFVDIYLERPNPDMVKLVESLLEIEAEDCLSQLCPHIKGLPEKQIRGLAKIVRKEPELPEVFRQAVMQTSAQLPETKGVTHILRKLFGKKTNKGLPQK